MSSWRRPAILAGSVLVALAAGIALGAGPFQHDDDADPVVAGTQDRAVSSYDQAFSTRAGSALVTGRLSGRTVAIVRLPGVDDDQVKAVSQAVKAAGGSVVSSVGLADKLLDPANRQFVAGIAGQAKGTGSSSSSSGYDDIGATLASALVSRSAPAVNDAASSVVTSFREGGLLTVATAPTKRAQLALVLTDGSTSAQSSGRATVLEAMVSALDARDAGTVVAGATGSGDRGGYVQQVRTTSGDDGASTFDALDASGGSAGLVLVAQHELTGKAGSYGSDAASGGPLP